MNNKTSEQKQEVVESKEDDHKKESLAARPTVICGPSGVGKGTLLDKVKELLPNTFGVAVSHTTRQMRKGEVNGTHYHFVEKKEFEKGIENQEFVEYADVHGNYYGTSIKAINDVCVKDKLICLLEIDYQGAKIIKESKTLNANYLFITCKGGLETLKERLQRRQTESDEQIAKRLKTAETEMAFLTNNPDFFECVLSNDVLEEASHRLCERFKSWYPVLTLDNLPLTTSSALIWESCAVEGLFNAMQFGVTVFDIRNTKEYNTLHAINARNISDPTKIGKLTAMRVFVYGNGGNEEKAFIRTLFQTCNDLKCVQFCVLTQSFERFTKQYPFLCTKEVQNDYPSVLINSENRIFIGGEAHANNKTVICDLGITHIVNTKGVKPTLDPSVKQKIKYLDINIDDNDNESVLKYFDKSCAFIENALRANDNNKVLIHCGGGKSRSTTFTMAFLIKNMKLSLAYSYGIVSQSRPKAYPNDGFLKQLSQYEVENIGNSSKYFVDSSNMRNKETWKSICKSWNI